ncbi:hypothetical protein BOX15_Mlig016276g3 [Macrostomum lignano]|uniref:Protein SDA1 n=2 Tax=Macrostomum lignano TaxID=282301 RepID=A0A267GEP0_9PLAT|nr:hypothetical protein BOX15_Mlig016276g3 [Macrostomum lignano]
MQKQKNLLNLQNLVKRDPQSYIQEFETAYDFFKSLFDAFKLAPTKYDRELAEQVMFVSQVSHCYRDKVADFPLMLISLLKQSASLMDSEMRMAFCKALILMRNKGLVTPLDIMQLFCRLFKCQDKLLRRTLSSYIVQDVKNVNAKHKNAKLNSSLQNHMLAVIQEDSIASKKCAEIMVELYRRGVWRDAKTVNFIGTCCFSKVTKILVTGLRFFCSASEEDGGGASSDDDSDIDEESYKRQSKGAALAHRVGPKTNKRKKRLERQLQALKKHKKKKRRVDAFDTAALHLLHDPQTFAEKLLKQVETTSEPFEIRLLMLDLCSRLVGVHKLQVLGLYPLLQRYLTPRQSDVTRLLLFAAQASHSMVPPDCLEPMVRNIADNFVTDRASAEAIAVGLNSIREICSRAPYAVTEELLGDLVQYRSYRDKNVSSAAKSLIQLYREANPAMLHRRDRGRPTAAQAEAAATSGSALAQFGQSDVKDYLPGAETLEVMDGGEGGNDDDDWGEEEEEDSDDGSGEWVDIPQSDDEDVASKTGSAAAAAAGDTAATALDPTAARLRAQAVATSRILSQRDFKRLEQAQALKRIQATTSGRKRRLAEAAAATAAAGKDNNNDDNEISISAGDSGHPSGLAQLSDITRLAKRPKMSRLERMESAAEGRRNDPDSKKYGFQVRRMNPHASSTNAEKRKSKAFSMVKHKARGKTGTRSFRDKQIAFRDALLKRMRKSKR